MATIIGTSGEDTLEGTANADIIRGKGADDYLLGNEGNDQLYGGGGRDQLDGGLGNDQLFGDDGDDFLFGGLGDDTLQGGAGNDFVEGGEGRDVIRGGAGNDSVIGFDAEGVEDADVLWGEGGHDYLFGDALDTLRGGTGNDLYGSEGTIIERSGEGNDSIYGGVYFDMGNIANVENLLMSGGIGFGNSMNNVLRGMYDDNGDELTLFGRGGNDHLVGNLWASNTYNGGAGADVFYLTGIWDTADAWFEREIVQDFEGGRDRIGIERLDVTQPTRFLTESQFYAGAGAVAQNENQTHIFDTDTGYLYYDPSGSAGAERYILAEIHVASGQLTYRDFYYMPDVPNFELG